MDAYSFHSCWRDSEIAKHRLLFIDLIVYKHWVIRHVQSVKLWPVSWPQVYQNACYDSYFEQLLSHNPFVDVFVVGLHSRVIGGKGLY